MAGGLRPVMLEAGEGPVLEALGSRCAVRISSADTGGAMAMVEVRVPPGEGPPMHLHRREEEAFHVLGGRFRLWCGDRSWAGGEEASVLLQRGIPTPSGTSATHRDGCSSP